MTTALETHGELLFREASSDDLNQVIALLVDDVLGSKREPGSEDPRYRKAFEEILANPRSQIMVLEQRGRVVACAQLDQIPNLSLGGALRGQIEGVRVDSVLRGKGIGHLLIGKLVDHCRTAGCGLVQLTTDKTREEALSFYEDLGFTPSHVGFKLHL